MHNRGVPVRYIYTDTGFISSISLIPVMRCFMDIWKAGHCVNCDLSEPATTCCWVLSDRLGAHRSAELLEMMLLNNFEPWSLPRNTTYFSSPLDLYLHANLKKKQVQLTSDVVEAAIRIDDGWKEYLLVIATEALKGSFTTACIERSFKVAGIWP